MESVDALETRLIRSHSARPMAGLSAVGTHTRDEEKSLNIVRSWFEGADIQRVITLVCKYVTGFQWQTLKTGRRIRR